MTTQSQINDIVWSACDTFRGAVDPAQYKDYVLVMLFLKYLSDLKKDRLRELRDKYGGDKRRVRRVMERERFLLPEDCEFDALYGQRDGIDLGDRLNRALEAIEDANSGKLEAVFRSIDFNSEANLGETKERNARLKHLLEDFANPKLDLRPSKLEDRDVIGDAYEYLISKFAADAGKKGGEFYTPSEVSKLLARIVAPRPGDRIADPCCGSGSLLIQAGKAVGSDNFALYGQESNGSTWALCRMNMFLHGMDSARIERGDSIRGPKLVEGDALMRFQVVVANPPFSLKKWGHEVAASEDRPWNRFHRGVPPKSRGDWAFVTHMLETMTEADGRAGVVVPHGVLFRGGAEGRIRRRVIEENLLDGVVGLPPNLFFGTGIPAALVFFRSDKPDRSILFIDASRDFEAEKNKNRLRPEDIDRIVATWRARRDVDKYARVVEPSGIAANDFNLNIPLYVDTFEEPEPVDLAAVQREIEELEAELAKTRAELNAALKELGV